MMIPVDRFHAFCKKCKHVWVAAYLPMEMRAFSRLMRHLMCPKCASGASQLMMATKEQAATLYAEAEEPKP